jgi:hypothetical protein
MKDAVNYLKYKLAQLDATPDLSLSMGNQQPNIPSILVDEYPQQTDEFKDAVWNARKHAFGQAGKVFAHDTNADVTPFLLAMLAASKGGLRARWTGAKRLMSPEVRQSVKKVTDPLYQRFVKPVKDRIISPIKQQVAKGETALDKVVLPKITGSPKIESAYNAAKKDIKGIPEYMANAIPLALTLPYIMPRKQYPHHPAIASAAGASWYFPEKIQKLKYPILGAQTVNNLYNAERIYHNDFEDTLDQFTGQVYRPLAYKPQQYVNDFNQKIPFKETQPELRNSMNNPSVNRFNPAVNPPALVNQGSKGVYSSQQKPNIPKGQISPQTFNISETPNNQINFQGDFMNKKSEHNLASELIALIKQAGKSPAWQRSEGKNPEGGLNAKGRASYKRETGGTLKAPVTESNPSGERAKRQNSFCSRMCGMKRVNTGSAAKSDPDSRINKSLRKWNCKCGEAHDNLMEKVSCMVKKAELDDNTAYSVSNIRKILDKNKKVKDYSANVEPNKGVLPFIKRNPAGVLGAALGVGGAYSLYDGTPPIKAILLASALGGVVGNKLVDSYFQRYLKDKTEREAIEDLTKRSNEKETAKGLFKSARSNMAAPPTIKDITQAYPYLVDLFDKNRRTASTFEKKPIVKDVPIASSYGEVTDAGEKQGLGFLKRNLIALMSRPTVWKGDNAFFFPEGKNGFIVSPKRINEGILRHELGHAEDYARLGGQYKWLQEYTFDKSLPFDEAYRRAILLPEARAWHYAGEPVNLNPEESLKERAFNTYVSGLDRIRPTLR